VGNVPVTVYRASRVWVKPSLTSTFRDELGQIDGATLPICVGSGPVGGTTMFPENRRIHDRLRLWSDWSGANVRTPDPSSVTTPRSAVEIRPGDFAAARLKASDTMQRRLGSTRRNPHS
jgi:hypothetical protein